MPEVVAVVEREDDSQVLDAARAAAELMGAEVEILGLTEHSAAERASIVLERLDAPNVVAAVLSAQQPAPVCWDVITRTVVPVIVVPQRAEQVAPHISHVLLPLDGTPEAAQGVAAIARLALDSGAQVTAVHVFSAATVPAFWDQAAHTHQHWTREFVRRHLPGEVELDLSSGRPAEEVLADAARQGVDLIVLAWSRNLESGHGGTVWRAIAQAGVPVLLLGISSGPSAAHSTPFGPTVNPSVP